MPVIQAEMAIAQKIMEQGPKALVRETPVVSCHA
jgi:hypothetical protein